MHKQLNGRTYLQQIQNVAYLCLGIPLLFFIYVYLESSVDRLESKIPDEYQLTFFVPLLLVSVSLITWGVRQYRHKRELARQADQFLLKLITYRKASNVKFLSYGISSCLITFGFYLTNFQAFAALFGIMIVLFSINNPNARKIATELRLKGDEKEIIIKGLDIA